MQRSALRRFGDRAARGVRYAVAILLLAAVFFLLYQLNSHYPIKDWLVLRYGAYWLVASTLFACVAVLGFGMATKIGGPGLPLRERLALAVPLGLIAFVLLWTSLGSLKLFNEVTFFVTPLVCLGFGAWLSRRSFRRLLAHRPSLTAVRRRPTLIGHLALAVGVLGTLFVYVPVLVPENVAFDARWYHLPIAEHYAAGHRFQGFPEGWMHGGHPQFATLVYSWAFCAPKSALFDHVELCVHLEFFIFLVTMLSIPVLVRRVLPGTKGSFGATWSAIYLFPGILVYDSGIVGGADHFAASWAVPIFLMLLRTWKELAPRPAVLLGLIVGGALSTKYTAFGLGLIPAVAVAVRIVVLGARSARRRSTSLAWAKTPPILLGALLLASSPHWLKNVVCYGNPVFPLVDAWFPTHPWVPETKARLFGHMPAEWTATHDMSGVLKTLRTAITFAFVPNDSTTFHKDWPVFGPLFSLTTPLVIFMRRPQRLALLYGSAYLFVLFWYWTFHQDRYLQACMPWMAAGTVAVLASIWQGGALLPKIPCALLVLVQLAWALDLPFFPTHAMLSDTPVRAVLDIAASGFRGRSKEFFDVYREWSDIGKQLPQGARVLIHETETHLGLGAQTVSDQLQTGISYIENESPEQVYDLFRRLGVTHIVTSGTVSRAQDSIGGDVAFFNFVTQYAVDEKVIQGHVLYRMPDSRPRSASRNRVLFASCTGSYENGVYEFRGLSVVPQYGRVIAKKDFPLPLFAVRNAAEGAAALRDVDAVVNNSGCFRFDDPLDAYGFVRVAVRDGVDIWVRHATRPLVDGLVIMGSQQSWGQLAMDRAVAGGPLRISGASYVSGLGTHAQSVIQLRAMRRVRLTGACGVDEAGYEDVGITFTIEALGGNVLYSAGPLKRSSGAASFSLVLEPHDVVSLKATASGSLAGAHADWVNLKAEAL